jgi:hypothetical protein
MRVCRSAKRSGCRKNSLTLIVRVSRTSSSKGACVLIAAANEVQSATPRRAITAARRRFICGSL